MADPVVTISRQHGSGGEEVAAIVSARLGVPLWLDEEIRRRAAERAGVAEQEIEEAEQPSSLIGRILERLAVIGRATNGDAVKTTTQVVPTAENFRALLDQVVREAAASGAVIIGHAAHLTLRDHPGVVRVFVQAPLEARVARLAESQRLPLAEARQQIDAEDRTRVRFYQETYHVNWYDSRLYDCVLDTHLLGIEGAAEVIVQMATNVGRARAAIATAAPATAPAAEATPARETVEAALPHPDGEAVPIRDGVIYIRPMRGGDAGRLLTLFRSLPPEDLLFLRRDVTDAHVIAAWERDVIDGRMLTLLAEAPPESGGPPQVVGEASLRRSAVPWTSHVAEVRAITSPAYRGRGLGTALLRAVLKAAAEAGIEKVVAETMAEQTGARQVLSQLGFVEEGRYVRYARDRTGRLHDLIVMTYTRPTGGT